VATPPATEAPTRNAAMTFVDVFFISTSFNVKDKFSLQPERKFKNDLLIGATYASTTQPLFTATFTVGSGFVAGPATTEPFLNGSKLALWTEHTINFLALKYLVMPPWWVQIV